MMVGERCEWVMNHDTNNTNTVVPAQAGTTVA